MTKKNIEKYYMAGAILLLSLLMLNFINVNFLTGQLSQMAENARPARINVTILESDCTYCYNITATANMLNNYNITSEQTYSLGSAEASKLIQQYGITKLPTIIITGELNKTLITGYKNTTNALIFDTQKAPYYDLAKSKVTGQVSATIIAESDCAVCQNMNSVITQLSQAGVYIKQTTTKERENATSIITQYNITKLPALILSKEIDDYNSSSSLTQIGFQNKGELILQATTAPYSDAMTGATRGETQLIILNDSACGNCTDIGGMNKQILTQGYGLYITNTTTIDINSTEGMALIAKYNITKVPTTISTGDVSVYAALSQVWPQVGSVESDGNYVFRTLTVLGNVTYKTIG